MSDSYWPPSSPAGWLRLIAGYVLLALVSVAGFVATFVLFGGWRLLDSVPTWLVWTVWGCVGLFVAAIGAGWVRKWLRPDEYAKATDDRNRPRR